jgi:dTDP-4-dehydrorhamnose 3,5-epimerase-like enzyme
LPQCRLIRLWTTSDSRGALTVIEEKTRIPFRIARVFYIRSQKKGALRGSHAHKTLHELIICLDGTLRVEVDTGIHRRTILLDDPTVGLYLPPMVWSEQRTCEKDTLYLVLASAKYEEADYIRDYDEFLTRRRVRRAS